MKGELAAATVKMAVVDKLKAELQGLKEQLVKAQSEFDILCLLSFLDIVAPAG